MSVMFPQSTTGDDLGFAFVPETVVARVGVKVGGSVGT